MIEYLFVYGTLKSMFKNPGATKLREASELVGTATIKGSLYDMGAYPALVLDSKELVYGELYKVKESVVFDWLDEYEEVPILYMRRKVKAKCEGEKYKCFVYEYAGHVYQYPRLESGTYEVQEENLATQ